MAKKLKTTNKPDSAIKDDSRESMFRGAYKDDVYEDDIETPEEVGTVEATQQSSEGFMGANNNASAVPNSEEIPTEKREHDYKKRYDDLKTYYDQKLNEWK